MEMLLLFLISLISQVCRPESFASMTRSVCSGFVEGKKTDLRVVDFQVICGSGAFRTPALALVLASRTCYIHS
jgi:hypothetical protein